MKMLKKMIAALILCAMLTACGVSSGTGENQPIDWDSLPKHPPFDYFTVSYYDSMKSRIYAADNEIDYFLADELYFLTHRGAGIGWSYSDDDWALFENVSRLDADRPVFKTALEVPDPIEDLQWEFVKNETPWVKFVWSVNALVSPDGSVCFLDRGLDGNPGGTIRPLRHIAVFLESPEEEGRLDYVIFTQDPETEEYLFWDAHTAPELGSWFRQELEMYAWHAIL